MKKSIFLISMILVTVTMMAQQSKPITGVLDFTLGKNYNSIQQLPVVKSNYFDTRVTGYGKAIALTDVYVAGIEYGMVLLKFVDDQLFQIDCLYYGSEVRVWDKFETTLGSLTNIYGKGSLYTKYNYPYEEGDGNEIQAIKSGKGIFRFSWEGDNGNGIDLDLTHDTENNLMYKLSYFRWELIDLVDKKTQNQL